MKYSVITLGCKVNQCESRSLAAKIVQSGHECGEGFIVADAYILNTCAVTSAAEAKSRQAVARVRHINSAAPILVMGCASERDPNPYFSGGIRYVSGTADRIAAIEAFVNQASDHNASSLASHSSFEDLPYPVSGKTRAYVKIQDGCDNYCSYCIVPYLRGRSRSRSQDSIEREIRVSNAQEIVLTGINLSDYRDQDVALNELLVRIGGLAPRIRLSSVEVNVIDMPLLRTMSENNFCPHFHLSLQSGSDVVLRAMNRHYGAAAFLEKVGMIRSVFPEAGITADVIVGFPAEGEKEFDETLDICNKARFSDMHIFAYSRRPGTKAAALKTLPPAVIKQRAADLARLRAELSAEFIRENIGRPAKVLFEEGGKGFTGNYLTFYGDGKPGEIKSVLPVAAYRDGLR